MERVYPETEEAPVWIALGCDEAAYDLKELIRQDLVELHHEVHGDRVTVGV